MIQHRVDDEIRNGCEIEAAVLVWMEKAEEIVQEAENLLESSYRVKAGCSGLSSSNIIIRRRLSKRAREMSQYCAHIREEGMFDTISYRLPLRVAVDSTFASRRGCIIPQFRDHINIGHEKFEDPLAMASTSTFVFLWQNEKDGSEKLSPSCSNALFPTARYTSFQSIAYSQFIGFDEQENKIRDLICESSYKAIGVYGMAGSGKTALILKLLNNPSVRNQFSPIIWLCLSDIRSKEDAEYEVNIVKYILCELGCDVDKWTVLNPTRPDLLKHLKNLLMSKKYLIVFDDVWENNEFYSNLGDALPGSDIFKNQLCEALPRDGGGKIIVTSRQREVGKNMVGEKNLISMKPLNRESCKMILEEEIGITGYAKKIEDLLNGSGIVSIGIYGPNSTANTALVRKVVFSTPSVREKFQPIIWVPVSRMSLNQSHQNSSFRNEVLNIGNEIVKYILTGIGCGDELTKDKSDFELMKIVNQSLRSKHYLIVLADVWLEGYGDATMEDLWNVVWERLSRAWPKDGDGVIIVTTELKEVVQCLVGDKNLVHVELPEWGTNEASEVAIDRHYISDDIVDQCCGLPFAAKTLGKIIREKGLQS
ncbi:disease resistance RPP13-like protein 4 [Senna tora]|uniref:Disease resistance RPP13-like protein 4 n=1 Tax=Senna tora TaxID=362788 RepID=A0A834XHU2_9FABA|nr:disease resistance RPP13-like protein 4 [Senna tora]